MMRGWARVVQGPVTMLVVVVALGGCSPPTAIVTRPAPRQVPPRHGGHAEAAHCRGRSVQAASLSGISFVNASIGVGVVPSLPACGARLATTADGGRSWRLEGARLPAPTEDFSYGPTLVFPTIRIGWIDGDGVLLATRDGGGHWSQVHLCANAPIAALTRLGSSIWAVVAPCERSVARYTIEATTASANTWRSIGSWPTASGTDQPVLLARLTSESALMSVGPPDGLSSVWLTTDGARKWTHVIGCESRGRSTMALAAADARDAFILCGGGVSMGSELKSLLSSTEGGHHWRVIATDHRLGLPRPRGSEPLPLGSFGGLVAFSRDSLWMATVNGVFESRDGGRHWAGPTPHIGGAAAGVFDVLRPERGWLLLPGTGLWATTNGHSWQAIDTELPS